MLPAPVAIARAGAPLESDRYIGVSFETMGTGMQALLGRKAEAITLGSRVFVAPPVFDQIVEGTRPDIVLHELAHVDQWRRDGGGFLVAYLGEYLRFRILGVPHHAAYRSISYEIDAFAAGTRTEDAPT